MTTASRSLATALPMGALRERLAPPSYTTNRDVSDDTGHCEKHDAPGVRPRAKQMQWPVADLL